MHTTLNLLIITNMKKKLNRIPNIHPGRILRLDFVKPLGISAYRLAKDLKIPQTRISQIMQEKRRITIDTAIRLGIYFAMSTEFWIGLQIDYDMEEEQYYRKDEYNSITPFKRQTKRTNHIPRTVAPKHNTTLART